MDDVSRPIAEYAARLHFDELPSDVVRAATDRLVDSLACLLGGFPTQQAVLARRLAEGGSPSRYAARVLGTTWMVAADQAAFANAAAIRSLDYNDTYPGGHPSDALGSLLALAERAGADGRAFLTAQVVAYETFIRLIRATRMRQGGWDQGLFVGLAAVAGLGSLLRLPAATIGHALAIFAAGNTPLRVTRTGELSAWKGAATPYGCRNAAFVTTLAAEGMEGPDRPFAGSQGVWDQVTGPFALEPFGARGGDFLLPLARLKYWPVEYGAQAAVWAALDLRERVRVEEVASVELATYHSVWTDIGSGPERWDPKTRETADHSLPFVFARALVDGTIGVESFVDAAVLDPTLRPVMAAITVRPDDEIEALWPAEVELRAVAITRDGQRHDVRVRNPRGHELNRMTQDDISAKFRSTARPLLGPERTEAALAAWWGAAAAPALRPLFDMLVVEHP